MMALYLPPLRAVSLLAALLVGAYGVSVGLAALLANWAATRVFSNFWGRALVARVCTLLLLLLWQIITCIYKHARRTLTSILAPQPRDADLPPELWALVAEHGDGLVDAWRLMSVCRAARAGAKEWLSTLPGLVVCGGCSTMAGTGQQVRDVFRLDLATLRWEPMPALVTAREQHTCCAVRGTLVVIGGLTGRGPVTSCAKVEVLSSGAFLDLPPLSRAGIRGILGAVAIEVDESTSAAGQVVLLGGEYEDDSDDDDDDDKDEYSTVHLVDLATGVCARQSDLLVRAGAFPAAARLPDGRIVCTGGSKPPHSLAEVWGPPEQGGADAAWTWRELPDMIAGRYGCCGCVLSDGRFAVLGGRGVGGSLSSCEALVIGDAAHWEPLPPMHESRCYFACAAVAGCVIVVGGETYINTVDHTVDEHANTSAEVYDESRDRWLRLPGDMPHAELSTDYDPDAPEGELAFNWLSVMGSALL
jgi:hypothetical protein